MEGGSVGAPNGADSHPPTLLLLLLLLRWRWNDRSELLLMELPLPPLVLLLLVVVPVLLLLLVVSAFVPAPAAFAALANGFGHCGGSKLTRMRYAANGCTESGTTLATGTETFNRDSIDGHSRDGDKAPDDDEESPSAGPILLE